jgi:hypothetical protein
MTAAELTVGRVLEDLAFPTLADEYVVSFVAFYERGFGTPSH